MGVPQGRKVRILIGEPALNGEGKILRKMNPHHRQVIPLCFDVLLEHRLLQLAGCQKGILRCLELSHQRQHRREHQQNEKQQKQHIKEKLALHRAAAGLCVNIAQ